MNQGLNAGWLIIIIGGVISLSGIGLLLGIPMICWGFNILNGKAQ